MDNRILDGGSPIAWLPPSPTPSCSANALLLHEELLRPALSPHVTLHQMIATPITGTTLP